MVSCVSAVFSPPAQTWACVGCRDVSPLQLYVTELLNSCSHTTHHTIIPMHTEITLKTVRMRVQIQVKLRWALFVTYTEYNQQWNVFSAFNPSKCTHTWSSGNTHTHTPGAVGTHTHTHTHLEQWAHTHTHTWSSGQSGEQSGGFGALLKGLTSVVDNSCRSRDSNPQLGVSSPTLYPLGHDCPESDDNVTQMKRLL